MSYDHGDRHCESCMMPIDTDTEDFHTSDDDLYWCEECYQSALEKHPYGSFLLGSPQRKKERS